MENRLSQFVHKLMKTTLGSSAWWGLSTCSLRCISLIWNKTNLQNPATTVGWAREHSIRNHPSKTIAWRTELVNGLSLFTQAKALKVCASSLFHAYFILSLTTRTLTYRVLTETHNKLLNRARGSLYLCLAAGGLLSFTPIPAQRKEALGPVLYLGTIPTYSVSS